MVSHEESPVNPCPAGDIRDCACLQVTGPRAVVDTHTCQYLHTELLLTHGYHVFRKTDYLLRSVTMRGHMMHTYRSLPTQKAMNKSFISRNTNQFIIYPVSQRMSNLIIHNSCTLIGVPITRVSIVMYPRILTS